MFRSLMETAVPRLSEVGIRRSSLRGCDGGGFMVIFWCVFSVVNIVLVLVSVFGSSWNEFEIQGPGVKTVSISANLFMIYIDTQCGRHFMQESICQTAATMNGGHTLHGAREKACSISADACDVMHKIYKGSLIIFFFYWAAIIFLICGAASLRHYWYVNPATKTRRLSIASFFLAPFLGSLGLLIWMLVVPNFIEIPRSWSHPSEQVFDCSPNCPEQGFPYGWSWCFSVAALSLMFLQLALWPCCVRQHQAEGLAEIIDENRQLLLAQDMRLQGEDEATPLLVPQAEHGSQDEHQEEQQQSQQQLETSIAAPSQDGAQTLEPHIPAYAEGNVQPGSDGSRPADAPPFVV